jgi:ubiquinone biosynthesis protein COQ9
MPDASDPLRTTEESLLDAALRLAPDRGWGAGLLEAAAREAGVPPAEAVLLLPGGAGDLAALLFRRHDAQALLALEAAPAPARTTARVRAAVLARVDAALADAPAVRRAAAWLALPTHAPLAARLTWSTADALWRWAGDTATDENHYSKRAILSGVLVATMAAGLAGGRSRAEAVLDRRLAEVGRFERWKAGLPRPGGWAERAAGALGGLRYGRGAAPAAAAEPARDPLRLTAGTGEAG